MMPLTPLFGPSPPDAIMVARAVAPLLEHRALLSDGTQKLARARFAQGVLSLRVFRAVDQIAQDLFPAAYPHSQSEINAQLTLQQMGFAPTNAVQTIVEMTCDAQTVILGLQTREHGPPLQTCFFPTWRQVQAVLAARPLTCLAWLDAAPLVGVIGLLHGAWHLVPWQRTGLPDGSWLRLLTPAEGDKAAPSIRLGQGPHLRRCNLLSR